ncbi:MAG TPA: tetratricopeptide repeat protein [Cyclobacteriaceae bacterium]|nr:tetratricopeptide repeat protein [Cyclobacteriaceae bacterium]
MKTIIRTALMCACTWLCLVLTQRATAQATDPQSYTAYVGTADVAQTNELWDKVVADKQAAFDKNPKDVNLRWNLALSQYGLMTGTMRSRDEDRFSKYYKVTEEHLEALSKDDKLKGEAKALLSGLYGLKIAYSSMMGMVLGPKSGSFIEEAVKASPESALVWKLQANSKMFTPSMFGGDMNEAIKAFEKSIALFEKQPEALKNNWLYVDTLVFLGQAYSSGGQSAKAVAVYEKALKIEPNLNWVKQELLPKARQKALGN